MLFPIGSTGTPITSYLTLSMCYNCSTAVVNRIIIFVVDYLIYDIPIIEGVFPLSVELSVRVEMLELQVLYHSLLSRKKLH